VALEVVDDWALDERVDVVAMIAAGLRILDGELDAAAERVFAVDHHHLLVARADDVFLADPPSYVERVRIHLDSDVLGRKLDELRLHAFPAHLLAGSICFHAGASRCGCGEELGFEEAEQHPDAHPLTHRREELAQLDPAEIRIELDEPRRQIDIALRGQHLISHGGERRRRVDERRYHTARRRIVLLGDHLARLVGLDDASNDVVRPIGG
jgi:hypothetical protein